MNRQYLVLVFCLVVTFPFFAQEYVDVIITHNGNSFKGIIIENKIDQYIKIELQGGSIFKVEYKEIDKILKEKNTSNSTAPNIVINNTNAQTMEGNNPNLDLSLIQYSFSDLSSVLLGLSFSELKSVEFDMTKMSQTDNLVRMNLYDRAKKNYSIIYSGINFFIPSVGSFAQGDYGAGIYQALSILAASGVIIMEEDMDSPSIVAQILLFNSLISYVSGIFVPFTYESKYNKTLRQKLNM